MNLKWPAVLPHLNGGFERDFVTRIPSTFTGLLAANIRLILINGTAQILLTLSFHHDLYQLMLHCELKTTSHDGTTPVIFELLE
ncbi:hypothetical protein A3197_13865 [Candidatus Thiodiazotropha endoloripes]|nr:hypothetical protein A3197_13865 [Candidatus Thiodiazotropha endoloripes]